MDNNDFGVGYAIGQNDSNCKGGNGAGGWGDGGWIWIILIFVLFAWGGWGNGGGYGNNGGGSVIPALGGIATRSDISEGFALNGIQSGITGIQQGLCDSTYALSNLANSNARSNELQLCQGFNGVTAQMNNLAFQAQQCCCDVRGDIKEVSYQNARNTGDIIQSTHNDTDRVLAMLSQMESNRQAEKIAALQTENQTLRFQASQAAQNGYIDAVGNSIIAQLRQPVPVPAYTVPAPYPYAAGAACGCNCGC